MLQTRSTVISGTAFRELALIWLVRVVKHFHGHQSSCFTVAIGYSTYVLSTVLFPSVIQPQDQGSIVTQRPIVWYSSHQLVFTFFFKVPSHEYRCTVVGMTCSEQGNSNLALWLLFTDTLISVELFKVVFTETVTSNFGVNRVYALIAGSFQQIFLTRAQKLYSNMQQVHRRQYSHICIYILLRTV